jgi:hypothetical protein
MKRFLYALALLPTPALANFECTILQQCGGGVCEPFTGGPMTITQAGDLWQVSMAGQTWEGPGTTREDAGEFAIYLPPQNGMSGLISIYPSGEVSFTAHAYGDMAVAITGSGTCVAPG